MYKVRTIVDKVPFEVFRAIFIFVDMGVMLDWEKLEQSMASGKTTIQVLCYEPGSALEQLYAPWYRNQKQQDVSHTNPLGKPLTHAELVHKRGRLLSKHRRKIQAFMKKYHTEKPAETLIATLAIGKDHALVLDGNHHLAATARLVAAGLDAPAIVDFRIFPAPKLQLVPDLKHPTLQALTLHSS